MDVKRLQISGMQYPGATTSLKQRWKDHQAGTACRTTKYDSPIALVYQEEYERFSEARKRESQIKRWSAKKKEALVADDLGTLKTLAISRDHKITRSAS